MKLYQQSVCIKLAIRANMYVAIRVVAHGVNIPGCVVVSMLVPATPVQAVLCLLTAVVGCQGALSVLVADGLSDEIPLWLADASGCPTVAAFKQFDCFLNQRYYIASGQRFASIRITRCGHELMTRPLSSQ